MTIENYEHRERLSSRNCFVSLWPNFSAHAAAVRPSLSTANKSAPLSTNKRTTFRCPEPADTCSGVSPLPSTAFTSLPLRISRRTIPVLPNAAAVWRGMLPSESLKVMFALCSSSSETISHSPSSESKSPPKTEERCKGVLPSLSLASALAPCLRRRRAIFVRSNTAHMWSGVHPLMSLASRSLKTKLSCK